jgi:cytochrome P450
MKRAEASRTQSSLTARLLQEPLNPFPTYRTLREQAPVYYSPEFHSWFVTRYQDVQYIIDHPELFSSQQTIRPRAQKQPSQPTINAPTLLWIDPPLHRQLRTLISQAFTPRAINNLATRIKTIVDVHLDHVSSPSTIDIIADLANPLPIIVIAELLGIPPTDQRLFKQWSDIIVSPDRTAKKQAVRDMNSYFLRIIEQRRLHPQDDLVSALLAAHLDDRYLSTPEILSFCRLLLVAGHETSTNLIGSTLLSLSEYPQALQQLYTQPDLIPSAIEEVIRFRTPIQRLRRAATTDTIIAGITIRAGDIVSPILGSANHDETIFAHPHTFDIHRTPNRHIGFGHGIHFCPGAPLARLETKSALENLLARFPTLHHDPTIPLQPVKSSFVYGIQTLPLRTNPT